MTQSTGRVNKKYLCFWVNEIDAQKFKDAVSECDSSMSEFLRVCVSYGFGKAVEELKSKKEASGKTMFFDRS